MIICVPFEYFHTGRDNQVAFLNTVTDQFFMFNGTHCWSSWKDFVDDFEGDPDLLERMRGLCPMWFLENE